MNTANDRSQCIRIGDLIVDTGNRTIARGSERIALPDPSWRLLAALVDAAPKAVSDSVLTETLRPTGHARPPLVEREIALLQEALGDNPNAPRYIGVIPGVGYTIIADVRKLPVEGAKGSRKLIAELGRRHVLQVALIYAAIAWSITEVVSFLLDALPVFPEWSKALVAIIFIVGFPVAMFLAWRFDIGPGGIKRTETTSSAGRLTIVSAILLLIGATSGLFYLIYPRVAEQASLARSEARSYFDVEASPNSIAVLPFINLSGDPSQDSFVDGMTEELLNVLATIKDLRVTSRSSSFAVSRQTMTTSRIAAALGVMHVLEGSVRKSGDKIRVAVQLIDTRTDTHLWSKTYDRELNVDNLLEMQQEVAEAVATALHAKISPAARHALSAKGPATLEAMNLYHDGLFYRRKIETGLPDDADFENAIEKFEASIRADPEWAPSHAALGSIYHFWKDLGNRDEKLRTSQQYLMKAIELDDQYGPAYFSLAYVNLQQLDFEGATHAMERAWATGSQSPWTNALYFLALGRYDEAVAEYRRAVAEDPISFHVKAQLAWSLACADRYAEAVLAYESLADLFPDVAPLEQLAYAYAKAGDSRRALELAERIAAGPQGDGPVAFVFALTGQHQRALAVLNEAEAAGDVYPISLARLAILLGDEDRALDILEREATVAPYEFLYAGCNAEMRSLAGNSRYQRILDRIGFPGRSSRSQAWGQFTYSGQTAEKINCPRLLYWGLSRTSRAKVVPRNSVPVFSRRPNRSSNAGVSTVSASIAAQSFQNVS